MPSRRNRHRGGDPFAIIYGAALESNIATSLWPWEIAEWACVSTSAAKSPRSFSKQLRLSRNEIWKRVNALLGVGVMCSRTEVYRGVNWLNNRHRSSKEAVAVFHRLAQRSTPVAIQLLTGGESMWGQYVLPRYDQTPSYTQSEEACWGAVASVMCGAVIESRRIRGRERRERGESSNYWHVEACLRRRLTLLQEFLEMTSKDGEKHVWQCLLAASITELSPGERAHICPAQRCVI